MRRKLNEKIINDPFFFFKLSAFRKANLETCLLIGKEGSAMKYSMVLFVMLIFSLVMYNGDANAMSIMDYEELVRTISRGISNINNGKDIAKDFIFLGEATNFIRNLPVK